MLLKFLKSGPLFIPIPHDRSACLLLMKAPLKIGVVDYLNSLPIYYLVLKGELPLSCEFVRGVPVELNQKMGLGQLDISLISSFEYAKHPNHYSIFPHLSISADGPVQSIYLFTQKPIESFSGRIHLTPHSYTSIHLLQYLLRKHDVQYLWERPASLNQMEGELLIGDEAIRTFYQPRFPHSYDLAAWWKRETDLPFVFAIWVVRREVYDREPESVHQICQTLIQSRQASRKLYPQMSEERYHGIFPTAAACTHYLENLEYDFSPRFQEGFLRFQQYCCELGFLQKVAPLRFISL